MNQQEPPMTLTAQQAWSRLAAHTSAYYAPYAAVYSGETGALRRTGQPRSFWRRPGKQKIHVPIAADIAATSSDLLFGEEIQITVVGEDERIDDEGQSRLEEICRQNNLHALLCEAAESSSALGDVYLKAVWDRETLRCPCLRVVQGDSGWPEYRSGHLSAVHIFTTVFEVDPTSRTGAVYRTHELYLPGKIRTTLFRGTDSSLGVEAEEEDYEKLQIPREADAPGNALMAAHIPNIRPNRMMRGSCMGRSDFDGQRDLMDALDEAYSSWIRDVRLGKARLIVPAEFLRRDPNELFGTGDKYIPTFSFDEDVETLAAIDSNPDHPMGITPSQFSIRASDHEMTCRNLIEKIVSGAGYAPQTFGINMQSGLAQSGTALRIREKKSYSTTAKKQGYWQDSLEQLLTSLVQLDASLYPQAGSQAKTHIHVRFPELLAGDLPTTASTVLMITQAGAASTEVKVKMLHPDWTNDQIRAETERIRTETGLAANEMAVEEKQLALEVQRMNLEAVKGAAPEGKEK